MKTTTYNIETIGQMNAIKDISDNMNELSVELIEEMKKELKTEVIDAKTNWESYISLYERGGKNSVEWKKEVIYRRNKCFIKYLLAEQAVENFYIAINN